MKDAVCSPLCSCAALSCCCSCILLGLLRVLCQICAAAGLGLLGVILSSFAALSSGRQWADSRDKETAVCTRCGDRERGISFLE